MCVSSLYVWMYVYATYVYTNTERDRDREGEKKHTHTHTVHKLTVSVLSGVFFDVCMDVFVRIHTHTLSLSHTHTHKHIHACTDSISLVCMYTYTTLSLRETDNIHTCTTHRPTMFNCILALSFHDLVLPDSCIFLYLVVPDTACQAWAFWVVVGVWTYCCTRISAPNPEFMDIIHIHECSVKKEISIL